MLKYKAFVICVSLVLAQDDDECESSGKFNRSSMWENKYNFQPLPNGISSTILYTSKHTTTELNTDMYPVGEERPVAEFYLILLKEFEVGKFMRIRPENAVTWVMGNTLRIYIIDEDTGKLTISDIGKGRQTFAFNRKGGLFAAQLKNPKEGKYALVAGFDIPGPTYDDYEGVPKDELLRLYPQHTELFEKLYS